MDFLQQLESGFAACGFSCREFFEPGTVVGFGVSGGADSMALLYGALLLREKFWGSSGAEFLVVSVNHNIRPPEECGGDALFVKEFCSRFSSVQCRVVTLPPGTVENTARHRKKGMEEAARFLRYRIFLQEAQKVACRHFCLAHNQNDQLETLLLRFLQGSGGQAAEGIPLVRDMFLRPLLSIRRDVIEAFLACHGVAFMQDKTNLDNGYLRNRCRNLLVPVLSQEFPGWEKGVMMGVEKKREDNGFISSFVPKDFWQIQEKEVLWAPWEYFLSFHPAVRRRILYQGLERLEVGQRIPAKLLDSLVKLQDGGLRGRIFSSGNFEFYGEKNRVLIRKISPQREDVFFSLIIFIPGDYDLFGRKVKVAETVTGGGIAGNIPQMLSLGGVDFSAPFVFRSPQPGDMVFYHGRVRHLKEIMGQNSCGDTDRVVGVVEELGKPCVTVVLQSTLWNETKARG